MFNAGEVDRFLSGELGRVLVIENEGTATSLSVESTGYGHSIAYVPVVGDSQFDIERALSHSACAAQFKKDSHHIVVEIRDRPQFYAVLKIALNHLGWLDEKSLKKSYSSLLPVERLAS